MALFITTSLYVHSKTIGKWKTDCMITYVNEYYPSGSIYKLNSGWYHFDKKWLEYMNKIGEADWCVMRWWGVVFQLVNTPYCYTSLIYEKTIFIKNNYSTN